MKKCLDQTILSFIFTIVHFYRTLSGWSIKLYVAQKILYIWIYFDACLICSGRSLHIVHVSSLFFKKCLDQTILSFIFSIVRIYRTLLLSLISKSAVRLPWWEWILSAIVTLSSHTCLWSHTPTLNGFCLQGYLKLLWR